MKLLISGLNTFKLCYHNKCYEENKNRKFSTFQMINLHFNGLKVIRAGKHTFGLTATIHEARVLIAVAYIRVTAPILIGIGRNIDIMLTERWSMRSITKHGMITTIATLGFEGPTLLVDQAKNKCVRISIVLIVRGPSGLCVAPEDIIVRRLDNSNCARNAITF